jgi:6-phosphogluconolactonase (cycloisomerase 2 family)
VFPLVLLPSLLSACGGGGAAYSIGGTVSGLAGAGLVLQDNGKDDLALTANGAFTFRTALGVGASYNITIKSQPSSPLQHCVVTNGSGSVASANVTSAVVTCTTVYTVGGTASGVAGAGLVLQLNGGSDLPITADGPFTFASNFVSGTAYAVSIKSQPVNPAQLCMVSNASGTIADANVTAPTVSCATLRKIGGTLQGLSLSRFSSGVSLLNNGKDDLTVTANGTFVFATTIPDGAGFEVTLKSQPTLPSQTCMLSGASGIASGADVSSIIISCGANAARFAFVGNTIGNIDAFAVQADASMQNIERVQMVHGGLRAITIDPSGQFLYAGSNLGYIEAYRLDQTSGGLSQVNGSPFVDNPHPSSAVVDPTSRFLYVSNTYGGATSQGSVSAYTIDAQSGALAEIPGSPYTVNYNPKAIAIDPTGHIVYVPTANALGQISVTAFAINQQTGALSQISGSPFSTMNGLPTAIVVHPDGSRLYVESAASNAPLIAVFSIDTTTGALTAQPTPAATGFAAFGMASAPSGKFLYATSANPGLNPGSISAYLVDATTGALSQTAGSPFQDTVQPTAIAVDPLSRYLFVTSQSGGADSLSGAVYVYNIDASTGEISGSRGPFPAGDYPYGLVVY